MVTDDRIEDVITRVCLLDKEGMKAEIRGFHGRFKLDFTEEYLEAQTVDRLRHILVAAILTQRSGALVHHTAPAEEALATSAAE